jgi:large subunit ribosomal protein L6
MSRIGNKVISIPAGVSIEVSKNNTVTVKGPKGTLTQSLDPDISVEIEGTELYVKRPTDQKRHKALHGLYRALVSNMVVGVSEGYKRDLEIIGVGYKASNQGNVLELTLGYSHGIFLVVPSELKLTTITEKGQNPKVVLEGQD